MNKFRLNLNTSSELLDNILNDYKMINGCLASGDLLSLLNIAASFTSHEIHSLLNSFNLYKDNSNDPMMVKEVFIMILNSTFVNDSLEPNIKEYLFNIIPKEDLEIMIKFFLNCLKLLPNQSIKRMSLLYPCVLYVSQQYNDTSLQEACASLTYYIKELTKKQEEVTIVMPSLRDDSERNIFENMSVLPQYHDIFPIIQTDHSKYLTYNKEDREKNTKYDSIDDYLLTQFSLLKEDFVSPLREAINLIREKFLVRSSLSLEEYQMKLYEDVIIDDLYPSPNGLVYRVNFDVKKYDKSFNWRRSSRFSPGLLVCFTNNFFDTLYFASCTEKNSDTLSKGILMVIFNEDPINEVILNNRFIMLETNIKNELYCDILRRVQSFNCKTVPFEEYFVLKDTIKKCPNFLEEVDLDGLKSLHDSDMDDNEMEAFSNGMQYKLSLIKGPSCTGKTYICLNMIKHILTNYQHKDFGPIMVIYDTDDALDNFILNSYKVIDVKDIIKLGGSNRTNILRECDISTIKWEWIRKKEFPNHLFVQCGKNKREMNELEECLSRIYIEILNCNKKLISFSDLSAHMNPKHVRYFNNNDFNKWITNPEAILSTDLDHYSNSVQKIIEDSVATLVEDVLHKILFDIVIRSFEEEDVRQKDDRDDDKHSVTLTSPDVFRRNANIKFIIHKLTIEPFTDNEYGIVESLNVDFYARIRLYRYWLKKYRDIILKEFKCKKRKYDNLIKEKELLVFDEYVHIMKSVKVIIMTSSSAAKYGPILDKIGSRIVMVEEAGKISECHLLCLLTKNCQQLILFGDDEAKECDTEFLRLSKESNMSFFHSLIKHNYKCFNLKINYQKVSPGQCGIKVSCGHLCTWLSHQKTPSHKDYICDMPCSKMCDRGIHQCKLLCSKQCKCEEKVDIELSCGHMANMPCYENKTLQRCDKSCKRILNCGHMAIMPCYENKTLQRCDKSCKIILNCGHKCMKKCIQICECHKEMSKILKCGHNFDYKCGDVITTQKCLKPCQRTFSCGHLCKKKCYETCVCNEIVQYTLICRHKKELKCGTDLSNYLCLFEMGTMLKCGHIGTYICFEGIPKCKYKEVITLPCRHRREVKCGEIILNIICNETCKKRLECGHICDNFCHLGPCAPCPIKKELHTSKSQCIVM